MPSQDSESQQIKNVEISIAPNHSSKRTRVPTIQQQSISDFDTWAAAVRRQMIAVLKKKETS